MSDPSRHTAIKTGGQVRLAGRRSLRIARSGWDWRAQDGSGGFGWGRNLQAVLIRPSLSEEIVTCIDLLVGGLGEVDLDHGYFFPVCA